MGPVPDSTSNLHNESPANGENEEAGDADQDIFGQDPHMDDISDVAMSEALSPGSKLVRDYQAGTMAHAREASPVTMHFKTLERPISSGEEASGVSQFQMQAPNLRSANVKRPDAVQRPSAAVQDTRSASPRDQVTSRPKTPCHTNAQATGVPLRKSPEECLTGSAPSGQPQRPATRGKQPDAASHHAAAAVLSRKSGKGNADEALKSLDTSTEIGNRNLVKANVDSVQQFYFAPLDMTRQKAKLVTETSGSEVRDPFDTARERDRLHQGHNITNLDEAETRAGATQLTTVLSSIEEEGVDIDQTLVEQTDEALPQAQKASSPRPGTQGETPKVAARPDNLRPVLSGRIVKHPTPAMRAHQQLPQGPPRPPSTIAAQPSEEDMFYLLMHRLRSAKDRELELAGSHKHLQAQNTRLHEQNRVLQQRFGEASQQRKRHESIISASKAEIDKFKQRFTKFKDYARDLAKDHADLGTIGKTIRSTQCELVREKDGIRSDLNSLVQATTNTSQVVGGLVPKISATARELRPLEEALRIANEKAKINEAHLKHERFRNNRFETQILTSQQVQERLSLSSAQEYRSAADYLDEMCHTLLRLCQVVTKKTQPKDTPGVEECLKLLTEAKTKQDAGITTLTETKTVMNNVSERLLTYHNTAEEASRTAANQTEQLSKDVLGELNTSLGAIGPSIATEVEFATLRERVVGLKTSTQLAHQAVNVAYQGKLASEDREREQSHRTDKLLEQLGEACKRQTPTPLVAPAPNPGPDVNVIFTKYTQANQKCAEEQAKVAHRDGVLHQKSLEIVALQHKLTTLQAEHDRSQSSLHSLEESHRDLEVSAEAAAQNNRALKDRLRNFETVSNEAARVPDLVKKLGDKDTELNKLKSQAAKLSQLKQQISMKDKELTKLQSDAAKVPELSQKLREQNTDLIKLRQDASKLPGLNQRLVDQEAQLTKLQPQAAQIPDLLTQVENQDAEITKLRSEASKVSDLTSLVSSKDAELGGFLAKAAEASLLAEKLAEQDVQLVELRCKAAKFDATLSENLAFHGEIAGHKNTIQTLQQQLATLKENDNTASTQLKKENTALHSKAADSQEIIASLETKLKNSELRSAEQVEVLQNQLSTLTVTWGDYDQLKKDLESHNAVHSKQSSQISMLQGKVEVAQGLADQVPALQAQIQQWSQKCEALNQKASDAKALAEQYRMLEVEKIQKEKEMATLKERLQKTQEVANKLESAQQETQQKNAEVATLQALVQKLQVDSQRSHELQTPRIEVCDEDGFPTQQTMLPEPATTLQRTSSATTQPGISTRKKADRTASGTRNNKKDLGLPHSHAPEPRSIHQTSKQLTNDLDLTQQIPDSQPQAEAQETSAVSSPLSEFINFEPLAHRTGKVQGDPADIRPPSSSHGGDVMLLDVMLNEDYGTLERGLEDPRSNTAETSQSQRQSQKHDGYGHASSRTIVTKGEIASGLPRLRSGQSSQIIEDTQSQEQQMSSPFVASSPAGFGRHLPNSAAKRPRLDPIESSQATQVGSKRLKRNPANLEVRKTPKRPESSGTQVTEPEPAHEVRVSLPSGSRKGSVIGANAPAPGKAQSSRRQTRKGSKADRYSERFNRG